LEGVPWTEKRKDLEIRGDKEIERRSPFDGTHLSDRRR